MLLLAWSAAPAYGGCVARIVTGPVKVRPYRPLPAAAASLICARNEVCSFQVVVSASGEDCPGVNVDVSEFVLGANKIPAKNITIFREEFINVFYRSNSKGDLGEWPDPLIPKVDADYGEMRNAFPYDLRRISRAYKLYSLPRGREPGAPRGTGEASASGYFSGNATKRFLVRIVKPGPIGTAAFVWQSEPGSARAAAERATSRSPVPLADGVSAAFRGAGRADDFLAGDEFWIFAGPERHQPVWVDVSVPENAAPGNYAGTVKVEFAKGKTVRLPFHIEVQNFALPATSSLPSYFGFYLPGVCKAHMGANCNPAQLAEMLRAYARAGLRNRISIEVAGHYEPAYKFSADGTLEPFDYTRFDTVVGPLLDGQGMPGGARLTSLQLPRFAKLDERQYMSAVRDFAKHARERGWFDRLFDYTIDEPRSPQQFARLRERARRVKEADAQLPRLATTELQTSLVGVVTRWSPIVNYLAAEESMLRTWTGNRRHPGRSDYNARLKAGDSLWWYQSCMSHGCGSADAKAKAENWPSYMVDASAAANRVFGLLSAVTYDISGVLYWDTSYAYHYDTRKHARGLDPWDRVYYFGGNGDGTLFYPGRPEHIGGKHHIPIESLRLKMIRDSFYDAEYAYRLRQLGEEKFLRAEVARVVQSAQRWSDDPQAWLELRRALASRLSGR